MRRIVLLTLGLGLALAPAGCSDNNNSTDAGPDTGTPDVQQNDVATDAPPPNDGGDAGGPAVSGTLAVTDVTVVDPAAQAVGLRGGAVSIEFDDESDGKGGTVVSGTSPLNGCLVTQYDPTHPPHGQLDADAITIADASGDAGTATGLLTTVGPCTYQSTMGGYVCISNNETNQAVTAAGNNSVAAGTVALVFSKAFTGEQLVGSYLIINGFTDTNYNSGTSAFPIVAQPADDTLVVFDAAGTTDAAEAAASGVSYTVLNGYAPVPGGTADFLGTGSISITKAANSVWPAINLTVDVPGDGWSLSDPGDPTAVPLTGTASDLVFGCANGTPTNTSDDTCGDGTNAALKVTVLAGTATKQDVTALLPFEMPTEVAGTDTWLEFQCAYTGSRSATLTAAAGQAIIDFNPTRVETRVITAAGSILTSGANITNVLVGHAIVGHTDHP